MTTHTPSAPSAQPHSSPEPPATLNALTRTPDPSRAPLSTTEAIDAHLSGLEVVRERQLAALPAADLDVVTAAHRATVEQILEEVRAARARLKNGTYGVCVACHTDIARPRLELRPYAARCATCATSR